MKLALTSIFMCVLVVGMNGWGSCPEPLFVGHNEPYSMVYWSRNMLILRGQIIYYVAYLDSFMAYFGYNLGRGAGLLTLL